MSVITVKEIALRGHSRTLAQAIARPLLVHIYRSVSHLAWVRHD